MSLFGKGTKPKKNYSEMDEFEEEYYEEYDVEDEESAEYDEEEDNENEPEEYIREGYFETEESAGNDGGEYYEEEYYGDDADYYERDNGRERHDEDSRYAEDEEEEDLDYIEDGEYDDYDDDEDFIAYRKKKGVAGALLAFRNMPVIDKVIACTGVAVLIFAVITGAVFLSAKEEDKAVEAFAEVGASLDGVKIIGESGLLAVADAQLAKEAAMDTIEEEVPVAEDDSAKGANVDMKMTSIVKDLKIKFVNKESDKLIANVPFEVEVTTPNKKTETWKDDDKDGVIYKEDIAAGNYKVKMLPLTGYDEYTLSTETQTVEVKATIAYKKVDVKEEIKTEAEVNAAAEDTAIGEVVEESRLTDTVPFVKSTATQGGAASYKEIDKGTIKDPATVVAFARMADYYLMTEGGGNGEGGETGGNGETGEGGETGGGDGGEEEKPPVQTVELALSIAGVDVEVGQKGTITVTKKENVDSIEWTSDKSAVASVNEKTGEVTGVSVGTATIKAKGTHNDSGKTVEATCTVTVKPAAEKATLAVKPATLSLAVGESGTITAESNQSAVTWASTDTAKEFADVTVSADGKTVTVKAKKAAAKPVTLTATAGDAQPATCTITITDAAAVTPDKTTLEIPVNKTADINVTTTPADATITAESSNTGIATVTVSGKKVTVKGVKIGDCTVTIKGSNGKEAKVTVKVTNGYASDTTSLLKDKNGNQVFVQENGAYRKAVYADYYKAGMKFYLETQEILYTGWQNINGKTYYFLENHKYVTGEQVIQGAKYNFASDGTLVTSSGTFGIDVSKWNGNIDWKSVKASGASYVIIRCGYRGSSTGALIKDPKFEANIAGANAAGLKVGVYFFSQAVNEKEAVEEASMTIDLIRKYKISYPVFLDVEGSGGRADGIDKATRTAVCKAYCATVQNSGYTAGVYANKSWFTSKIDAGALGAYKIWLAQYAAAPTYNGRYNMWQYSSKGSIPGISGNVDLNLSYLGY